MLCVCVFWLVLRPWMHARLVSILAFLSLFICLHCNDRRGCPTFSSVQFKVLFFFFSIIILQVGEVIGFRLFQATGLAFAIRPKDSVAKQGRRGGFHCYRSKGYWNNVSVMVRVRDRAILYSKLKVQFKVQFKVQCSHTVSGELSPFPPGRRENISSTTSFSSIQRRRESAKRRSPVLPRAFPRRGRCVRLARR